MEQATKKSKTKHKTFVFYNLNKKPTTKKKMTILAETTTTKKDQRSDFHSRICFWL